MSVAQGEAPVKLEAETVGAVSVLSLQGRLDSVSAGPVESEIMGHLGEGANRLVLDFSSVSYVSSAGLRVVLVVAKRLRETGGKFVLSNLVPSVHEVFSISGFLQILTVCPDRPSAIEKAAA